jgi:hypothetical protein
LQSGNSRAARAVIALSASSFLSQGILIVVMPLLSRLFSPEELGVYTVTTSLVGLFATTIALHFELAIPLARRHFEIPYIVYLALLAVGSQTVIFCAFMAFSDVDLWRSLTGLPASTKGLWIPALLALTGLTTVLSMVSIRSGRHYANAAARLSQSSVQSIAQLGSGALGYSWHGLLVGQILGLLANAILLLRAGTSVFRRARRKRLIAFAKKYKAFPLHSVPSSLVNALSNHLPILVIARFFGLEAAGLYGLCLRAVLGPSRILSQSFSQVFLGEASDGRRGAGLAQITMRNLRTLVSLTFAIFLPFSFVAPDAFALVFGAAWRKAGEYCLLIMPWIIFGFVTTPLSMLVTITGRQKTELQLQLVYFVVICAALALGVRRSDILLALAGLGALGGIYLLAKLFWLAGLAEISSRDLGLVLLIECAIGAAFCTPIVAVSLVHSSDALRLLTAVVSSLLLNAYNLRVRKAYAL